MRSSVSGTWCSRDSGVRRTAVSCALTVSDCTDKPVILSISRRATRRSCIRYLNTTS